MHRHTLVLAMVVCIGACSTSTPPSKPANPGSIGPGGDQLPAEVGAYAQELQHSLQAARATSADDLEAERALPFSESLGYDPLQADHLSLIQSSRIPLQQSELDVLSKRGFVIADRQRFPSFMYGYSTIYAEDLPVYISADSILDAVHRSYDGILMTIEQVALTQQLESLLSSLLTKLQAEPDSQTRADLTLYLSVAKALLRGGSNGFLPADQRQLVDAAVAASGSGTTKLFGVTRNVDFSQFKPRGHYDGDPQLENYFRAMMWLGKIDFQLVETVGTEPTLRRPQVEAMLLLHGLFGASEQALFHCIDEVVHLFVGESDNMTLQQVPSLLMALGIQAAKDLAGVPDAKLKEVILSQGFGKQQIMSHLMLGGIDAPVPLNASFLLFGQRYVVDSHVFSNVVWDRVRAKRMMPNPLDVAFAALGNDQAPSLLHDELARYPYAGDLAAMRTLVDHHEAAFWNANLYNDWLGALRALSPEREAVAAPAEHGLPSIAGTSGWGRRILGTQLASWAQLRHDTILYAKQSYSAMAVCEFPDAAVDPYPEFYAALSRFAEHGHGIAMLLDGAQSSAVTQGIDSYFTGLKEVAEQLKSIAEAQRDKLPLTAAQMAFINETVVIKKVQAGCVSIDQPSGWYTRLFFAPTAALKYDPTVADVHTQPTDEAGAPVGRVLHVATGRPRLMVVTMNTCGRPKAYVGLASSYYEHVTEKLLRLTDEEWSRRLDSSVPPEPKWIQDLVPGTAD